MAVACAIVGGGFCGTLVAVHLLRGTSRPLSLLLFDRSGTFGPGLAYGPADGGLLLNAPADRMSPFPDDPLAFARWACSPPDAFLPRARYGAYLTELLERARAASPARLELRSETVVEAERVGKGWRLGLAGGGSVAADVLVLATGVPAVRPGEPWRGLAGSPRYVAELASRPLAERLPSEARVFILGTGLSMVDAVCQLQGHRGPIRALSRRGLLPRLHPGAVPVPPPPLPDGPLRLGEVVAWARERTRDGLPSTRQAVAEALRLSAPRLWRDLSLRERRRFLRHLRPYWETLRHPMPPAAARALQELRRRGRLTVHAGRVLGVRERENGLELEIRLRSGKREIWEADVFVDCGGPAWDGPREPVVESLVRAGLATADELGLGIRSRCDSLHLVGPLRKGELWESYAIRELRDQAASVARTLLKGVRHLSGAGLAEEGAG